MDACELNFILATAGHVDHGKSTLIRALTGTDPDRLPEEKVRGMTIDLGYADLLLELPGSSCAARIGFVDVPGHEDFIKNMIAGVSSCDAALFVVAADDGWMPQSEEHLQILEYLGVQAGVVAITKSDQVGPTRMEEVLANVRSRLKDSPLSEAEVIPCSGIAGSGLVALNQALARLAIALPPRKDLDKPRLHIDRAFSPRGLGTVVTGTLIGGKMRTGDPVTVLPRGLTARIRGMHCYHKPVSFAVPGTRVALNLPTLDLQASGRAGVQRGDVVTRPGLAKTGDCWDVSLLGTRREQPGGALLGKGAGFLVRVHHGTSHSLARCVFHHRESVIPPGSRLVAQLRFNSPLAAFAGDRFVLRDNEGKTTLAGGIVLDPFAMPHRFHSAIRQASLAAQAQDPLHVETVLLSRLAQKRVLARDGLLAASLFSEPEIGAALAKLQATGRVRVTGTYLVEIGWWRELRKSFLNALLRFHAEKPEAEGMPMSDLITRAGNSAGATAIARDILAELASEGFAVRGSLIVRHHCGPIPAAYAPAAERIRNLLTGKPLDPPARNELTPDRVSQAALRFLITAGEAVDLSADLVLGGDAYQHAREAVLAHLKRHGPATVSQLRVALGTTRRVLVPLLERLDSEGVTRREGDQRLPANSRGGA